MPEPIADYFTDGMPDPDLEPLHDRRYVVRAWRIDRQEVLLRGLVVDHKPGHLWPGDPTRPLVLHHIVIELTLRYPAAEIIGASLKFNRYPYSACPQIAPDYGKLVGLAISRGFSGRVRAALGGPAGCTHAGALLQAMAPVAAHCGLSMRFASGDRSAALGEADEELNRDTCHIWAEGGSMLADARAGRPMPIPLPIHRRLVDAGVDPSTLGQASDSRSP